MAGGEELAQALWYVGAGPGRNPAGDGFRRSRTARSACARVYSAISRGTEALIAAGPGAGERIPAHARAVHGRQLSRSR